MINVSELHKSYGSSNVLAGVELSINPGTVYGLVGLNGAGKTTLMRLLLGLLKPDKGHLKVIGYTPWDHQEAFYSKIGVVLENDGFWGNLTIKENLKIFASAKKLLWKDVLLYIDQFWDDTVIATSEKKVKHLSRGQRVQCALCRAFLGWPRAVLLDEPAIALDMTAYDHFQKIVRISRQNGSAIIISSHQLDTIEDLCDRVGILSNGVLSELETHSNKNKSIWMLSADNDPRWKELLLHNGCQNVNRIENEWYFDLDDPKTTIPVIINKLVYAGCQIYEIKQNTTGIRDTIRSAYKSDCKKDLSV